MNNSCCSCCQSDDLQLDCCAVFGCACAVLSAVSGLQVKAGLTNSAVIGITCAILVMLFAIQSWGTQRVGVLFAPTVALWFLSNVLVGIYNISMFEGGAVFRALSPHYIGKCTLRLPRLQHYARAGLSGVAAA